MPIQRVGRCAHYNGTINDCCEAGINYRQHVGGPDYGWATRLPCLERRGLDVVPCDKCREPTPEEIAESAAWLEDAKKDMELICTVCSEAQKRLPDGGSEVVECPKCKGKLHISVANVNKHVWGKCETTDCLSWMQ